jgi:hypothetical protein
MNVSKQQKYIAIGAACAAATIVLAVWIFTGSKNKSVEKIISNEAADPKLLEDRAKVATDKPINSAPTAAPVAATVPALTTVTSQAPTPTLAPAPAPVSTPATSAPIDFNASKTVTVSAPGKILIAGGYLVLMRPNIGLVVSANARFYTTATLAPLTTTTNSESTILVVNSPQFHSSFTFEYSASSNKLTTTSPAENKFVEKCISVVLSFASEHFGPVKFHEILREFSHKKSLCITMQADNDFYSQIKLLKDKKRARWILFLALILVQSSRTAASRY